MTNIYYKSASMSVPGSFQELSSKQFIKIAQILFEGGDKLISSVKALRILAGYNRIHFFLLDTEFIERALPFIDWIFSDAVITEQKINSFKNFHGPISDFDNLKMSEFHYSELAYKELVYEGNHAAINSLIAVLYRKPKPGYNLRKNPDGDIRVPFNANELEYYASKIARWPDAVKQAIFLWYDACRQHLITNNELIFKEPTRGFESQFETGLYGMMRSLAGEKLGSVSDIEEMYVHTAMLELSLIKEEEQNMEEELKRNRT